MHFILKIMWTWHRCFIHWGCWTVVHLAVGINYRSQQLPGACSAVHPQHAQDLQEPQAPDGRGGKNVALRSSCQHRHWGNQHHDICGLEGKNCTQFFESTAITVNDSKSYSGETLVYSPMTQKGFRANFSLPLHPLYRQQQPADHIRTMYSTPKTTMVTISCIKPQRWS